MNLKIALVYVDSGGGHRAAAQALAQVISDQHRPWDVELVSIQNMLDPIDFIRKYTGVRFQDVYNIMLRRGWTAGLEYLIPIAHGLIRQHHDAEVAEIATHWDRLRPDMVVSLIPHYNRALKEALDRTLPGRPFVTVLTDIADFPPHFWIEAMDQHVICGSHRAAEQAAELGIPADRILRTSGMILHPKFYEPPSLDRRAERLRLGLDPERPTGLVLFGGEGSNAMLDIARALNAPEIGVQLILICGKNERLRQKLQALDRRVPMYVEGFTREIPSYMALSDFFIGKPGPGSISEALAMGLPVIVQRNLWTMAHERYNTQWVEEHGVGTVVKNFRREIAPAVRHLLEPENYRGLRSRVAAMHNRAVFEIPSLLERIFETYRSATKSGTQLLCAIPPR